MPVMGDLRYLTRAFATGWAGILMPIFAVLAVKSLETLFFALNTKKQSVKYLKKD